MKDTAIGLWFVLAVVVVTGMGISAINHQPEPTPDPLKAGREKAALIKLFHNELDVSPELAQHVNITVTNTDVRLDIGQFTVLEGNNK